MIKNYYRVINYLCNTHINVSILLSALAILGYIVFSYQQVIKRGLFEYVGIDFRLFYASGQIIRDHGFHAVYDTNLQTQYQLPIYEGFSNYIEGLSLPFWALQIPYLPFFLPPFTLLTSFSPSKAFLFWLILNLTFTIGYLTVWSKRIASKSKSKSRVELILTIIISASIQNFLNLLFGQVNLILMISIGESLFNIMQRKYSKAGLWLTLGWIKPQMVILLSLLSLIHRNWAYFGGFLSGSIFVGVVSLLLGGWKGIEGVLSTLRNWLSLYRSSGITWLSAVDHLVMHGMSLTLAITIGIFLAFVALIAWIRIVKKHYLISKNNMM